MEKGRILDPIKYLVDRKFSAERNTVAAAAGSGHGADQDEIRRLEADICAYREKLEGLSQADLKERVAAERAKEGEERAESRRQQEANLWFNKSGIYADFPRWAAMPYWSLDEAVALSLGRNPNKVNWSHIQSYVEIYPFAGEYAFRMDLVQRARKMQHFMNSVAPAAFLKWAAKNGLIVAIDLILAVEARTDKSIDWEKEYQTLKTQVGGLKTRVERLQLALSEKEHSEQPSDDVLGTRERNSLLKLVIGMAVGGYAFDPTASKSHQTKEIADDLCRTGVSLDEDTVRKYLKEAAQLLEGRKTE